MYLNDQQQDHQNEAQICAYYQELVGRLESTQSAQERKAPVAHYCMHCGGHLRGFPNSYLQGHQMNCIVRRHAPLSLLTVYRFTNGQWPRSDIDISGSMAKCPICQQCGIVRPAGWMHITPDMLALLPRRVVHAITLHNGIWVEQHRCVRTTATMDEGKKAAQTSDALLLKLLS